MLRDLLPLLTSLLLLLFLLLGLDDGGSEWNTLR